LLKKTHFFLFLGLFFCQTVLAQNDSKALIKADSLFEVGALLPAYKLYRQTMRQGQQHSPRLLVRMAYIQEQIGHYPAALYYLNVLQTHAPSQATWNKMVELAQNNRLDGYTASWPQRLLIPFRRYYNQLLQAAFIVAVVAGTVLLIRLLKRRRIVREWWVLYGIYLLLAGVLLNLLRPERVGLVCQPRAALMSGPAAGANWLTVVAAGDRLQVEGVQDIWYQVEWHGRTAFIRKQNLLLVE
jgi:hypothetical protein